MPFKDPEKKKEYARKFSRKQYWKDPEKARAKVRIENKIHRAKLKQEFLQEYGGKCSCCGETTPEFLTVAHLDDSGAEHRRAIGGSQYLLQDLKKRNWPKDVIGILCMNCQFATTFKRICPHARIDNLR